MSKHKPTPSDFKTRPLLLIGSIPGDSAESVMREWGAAIGPQLVALPDGETGYRRMWMEFLCARVFDGNAGIETLDRPPPVDPKDPSDWRKPGDDWISLDYDRGTWLFQVRGGVESLRLAELGYAKEAIASYKKYRQLQAAGALTSSLRFQVSIPLHDSSLRWYMANESDVQRLWKPYTDAVAREIAQMLESIPAEDLVIQWDACAETLGFDEAGAKHWRWQPKEPLLERFAESIGTLSRCVPAPVGLGLHLCYGSFGETHLVEPRDLGCCVQLANTAVASVDRSLDYVHMPVPRERTDEAFFAPLGALRLGHTRLFLGLVHGEDEPGNRSRFETAKRFAPDFGVAAECGFGRASPAATPALIEAHRAMATLLG